MIPGRLEFDQFSKFGDDLLEQTVVIVSVVIHIKPLSSQSISVKIFIVKMGPQLLVYRQDGPTTSRTIAITFG